MIVIDNIRKFIVRNPKGLGYFLIVASLILFVFSYQNSKLGINDLTEDNIQYYAEEINGLGVDTLQNIVANKPYTDMVQLKNVEGVGEIKYKILIKHFGSTEPCRRGTFILSIFLMIFFGVVAHCIIKCENERNSSDAKLWMNSFNLKPEDKTKEKVKYKMKE